MRIDLFIEDETVFGSVTNSDCLDRFYLCLCLPFFSFAPCLSLASPVPCVCLYVAISLSRSLALSVMTRLITRVVSVYGAIASPTELTLVMEYAERGSLRSVRATNMFVSICHDPPDPSVFGSAFACQALIAISPDFNSDYDNDGRTTHTFNFAQY